MYMTEKLSNTNLLCSFQSPANISLKGPPCMCHLSDKISIERQIKCTYYFRVSQVNFNVLQADNYNVHQTGTEQRSPNRNMGIGELRLK